MGLRSWYQRVFTPELAEAPVERDWPQLSFNQFVSYLGNTYPILGMGNNYSDREEVGPGLEGLVNLLGSNSPALSCLALRLRIFSDIRFQFREITNGRPGKLKGAVDGRNPASAGLKLLQTPEPGLTTGDLLARMIQYADHAGNAFVIRRNARLRALRPDWMTIVVRVPGDSESSPWDIDSELIGYLYLPGGPGSGRKPIRLLPEEVAHWAPIPDPLSVRRGSSWVNAILREVLADTSATRHEGKFFDNDATVNQQLVFEPGTAREVFEYARENFNQQHAGIDNAYKTLFVLGAELKKVGTDFKDMDFTALQGRFETRIAAASGVGPVLTFLSEGLQGSALNAGNFDSARRAVADMTFRPLWRNLCGSLAHIIEVPVGTELWYDDRDVMFLQEDRKDAAVIEFQKAQEIRQLIEAGYEADPTIDAVMAEDLSLLKGNHTGLFSVQLQAPGSTKMPVGEVPGEAPVGPGGKKPETAPQGELKPAPPAKAAPQTNGKASNLAPAGKNGA